MNEPLCILYLVIIMKQGIKVGDIITKKIKQVRLHKEERRIIGELGSSYSSCYVAILDCPEEILN